MRVLHNPTLLGIPYSRPDPPPFPLIRYSRAVNNHSIGIPASEEEFISTPYLARWWAMTRQSLCSGALRKQTRVEQRCIQRLCAMLSFEVLANSFGERDRYNLWGISDDHLLTNWPTSSLVRKHAVAFTILAVTMFDPVKLVCSSEH